MTKKIQKTPSFLVEFERETDKRWIADVPKLPGVMAYGKTKDEARKKVFAIALRTLADKVERGITARSSLIWTNPAHSI